MGWPVSGFMTSVGSGEQKLFSVPLELLYQREDLQSSRGTLATGRPGRVHAGRVTGSDRQEMHLGATHGSSLTIGDSPRTRGHGSFCASSVDRDNSNRSKHLHLTYSVPGTLHKFTG